MEIITPPFFIDPSEHPNLTADETNRYRATREFLLTRGWGGIDRIPASPPESSSSHRLVRTPGGHATLLYGADSGQQGILHHTETPDEKKRDWWKRRFAEDPDLVVFHGLGLGYSIPEILERADRDVHFLIVEADTTTFRFCLALRDCLPLFRHPNIRIVLPRTAEEAGAITHDWLTQTKAGSGRVRMLVDPPGMVPQPNFLHDWYDALAKKFPRMAETLAKGLRNEYPHPTNLATNWPLLQTRPGVGRLFGKMERCPAVVVGAGPSLDDDLSLIKEIEDRVLIVACDTALRPLLSHGVRVDFALAIDSSPRNHDHFKGLPETPFLPVLFGGVHSPLLEQYRDHAWIAATAPFPTVDLLEDLPGPSKYLRQKGTLVMNGSVGTGALDLAMRLGCSPIFLSGIDLAYSEGKDHARGTIYDEDAEFQNRQPALFEVPSVAGGIVSTCSPFLISLFGVLHQLECAEIPVYNLSSGGAAIPGAKGREEGLQLLRSLTASSGESPRKRLEVEADLALRAGGRRRRERGADSSFPIDPRGRLRSKPDREFRISVAAGNLEVLDRTDPVTAEVLRSALGVLESGHLRNGETCEWLRSSEGFPRLAIRTPQSGAWLIPAMEAPWEEVSEWRAKGSLEKNAGPLLLGAGLGFHLRDLLEGLPENESIWVWEPLADRFMACLGVADFRSLFEDPKNHWAVGVGADELIRGIVRRTPDFLEGRPLGWRPWVEPCLRGWTGDAEGEFLKQWFALYSGMYPKTPRIKAIRVEEHSL